MRPIKGPRNQHGTQLVEMAIVLPLLAFYALARKRLNGASIQVLGIPIVLMGAWQLSGYLHRGVSYASTMFEYIGVRGLWLGSTKLRIAIMALTYLGGTILLFPFIFWKMGMRWNASLPSPWFQSVP